MKWIKLRLILFFLFICSSVTCSASNPTFHPIVAGTDGGILIGGSVNQKWVTSEKDVLNHLQYLHGGEIYNLYCLNRLLGQGIGGAPTTESEGAYCGPATIKILLQQEESLKEIMPVFAIMGDWNVLPRPTTILGNQNQTYKALIADFLAKNKLYLPSKKIVLQSVLKFDLEGDGKDEVLICASNLNYDRSSYLVSYSEDKTYSVILLRKIVDGKVVTIELYSNVFTKANPDLKYTEDTDGDGQKECHTFPPCIGEPVFVGDLNGDGIMEIIISSRYYEGESFFGYSIINGQPKLVLEGGWGA